MIRVSELFIYPVKSLAGIAVSSASLTDRGFQYDRRWMLIDQNNQFLTQRECPEMALLQTSINNNGIIVNHRNNPEENTCIPFSVKIKERPLVQVWDDWCEVVTLDQELNEWFSDQLHLNCKLVYMPDDSRRKVDGRYAIHDKDITAFSDGYPLLMISQASLDDLNERLDKPLPVNRFRPNVVLEGTNPYEEDEMEKFRIGNIDFYGVKLSARCVITTINQDSLEKGKEPLRTLFSYRMMNNKVYFGQNVIHGHTGLVKKGDTVEIIRRKSKGQFMLHT